MINQPPDISNGEVSLISFCVILIKLLYFCSLRCQTIFHCDGRRFTTPAKRSGIGMEL